MAPEVEMQKPRITEIQVRMDCKRCVQKIKRALRGINDPEEIVKAINKTRKSAIICSELAPQGGAPAQDSSDPPPAPAEPPKDPPPPENPPPEEKPSPEAQPSPETAEAASSQPSEPVKPKDVEEVHVIYHYPPDYVDTAMVTTSVMAMLATQVHIRVVQNSDWSQPRLCT